MILLTGIGESPEYAVIIRLQGMYGDRFYSWGLDCPPEDSVTIGYRIWGKHVSRGLITLHGIVKLQSMRGNTSLEA